MWPYQYISVCLSAVKTLHLCDIHISKYFRMNTYCIVSYCIISHHTPYFTLCYLADYCTSHTGQFTFPAFCNWDLYQQWFDIFLYFYCRKKSCIQQQKERCILQTNWHQEDWYVAEAISASFLFSFHAYFSSTSHNRMSVKVKYSDLNNLPRALPKHDKSSVPVTGTDMSLDQLIQWKP